MKNNLLFKSFFNELLDKGIVPEIENKNIKEFIIGKSYFYKIQGNDKLLEHQEKLNHILLEKIELNNASVAFRKGFSYLDLLEPHRKNYNFIRIDIRSFFHSIRIDDIKDVFKTYISDSEYIDSNKKQTILDAFINIVTYKIPSNSHNKKFKNERVIPMGFKTSPLISNIIFRKIDIQIQKICSSHNITYTRYADDMLFSSPKELTYLFSEMFINEMRIILSQMKFIINEHKTIKSKHTLSLNGYTIQYSYFKEKPFKFLHPREIKIFEVRISNKKTYLIKKLIHEIIHKKSDSKTILKKLFGYKIKLKYLVKNHELINQYYEDQLLNKIIGYRSYLLSFIKYNKVYMCTRDKTIEKYSKIIDDLDVIINSYYNR